MSCSLAYWLRFNSFIIPSNYFLPTVIYLLFSILSLQAAQHYTKTHPSYIIRIKTAFLGVFLAGLCTSMFLYMTKSGQDFSRIWLFLTIISSLLLVSSSNLIMSFVVRRSVGTKNVILLGDNITANSIKKKLTSSEVSWLSLTEHYRKYENGGNQITQKIESQRSYSAEAISEVWITHDIYSTLPDNELLMAFGDSSIDVVFIPELPSAVKSEAVTIEYVSEIPTINSKLSDTKRIAVTIKYLEDKLISALLILITWPILATIALLIKIDSRGSILFRQTRYGINGHEFNIIKFRTMYSEECGGDFFQATKNDSRITKVGRILRKTSLDELPQLFNVLVGDMSLVGPRPHPTKLNEQYRGLIDGYMNRHLTKPGITGLAQIKGFRGETPSLKSMENRINLDVKYINNWSLWLDFKILFLTAIHLIRSKEAY